MSNVRTFVSIGIVVASTAAFSVKSAGQTSREDRLEAMTGAAPGTQIAAGRALFEKTCAVCHKFGPVGAEVGPDLTAVNSRFKKRDILESILFPSRTVSDQYQSEEIKAAGKTYNALVVRETAAVLQIRANTDPAKPISLQKGQIESRNPSKASFMPEGLVDKMTNAELANLIAFIQAGPPKAAAGR
jgi:putative heme-binding domain-containing protein